MVKSMPGAQHCDVLDLLKVAQFVGSAAYPVAPLTRWQKEHHRQILGGFWNELRF
jgi:hypothetical protein